jgi:transposase
MLSFTGSLKIYVALKPVDLRKSFNGLEALVSERLHEDLRAGALFVCKRCTEHLLTGWVREGGSVDVINVVAVSLRDL